MFLSLYELWDHDSPECQHGPTDITVASPGYLGKYQKTIINYYVFPPLPPSQEFRIYSPDFSALANNEPSSKYFLN